MPTSAATQRMTILTHGKPKEPEFHYKNTIVQTLDASVEDDDGTKTFYPKEPFLESPEVWSGCPLIFDDGEHPDVELFESNPEEAMKAVGGVPAGEMLDPRVEIEGQPRLMGSLKITHPGAIDLWNKGNLSLSTAFTCSIRKDENGNRVIVGDIKPNHIIIFPRDKHTQRDKGTFILNSESAGDNGVKDEGKVKAAFDTLKEHFFGKTEPQQPVGKSVATNSEADMKELEDAMGEIHKLTVENATLKADNAALKTENEGFKGRLTTIEEQVKTLTATNSELTNSVEATKKEVADRTWAEIKNTLPKGMTATPEAETELRTLMEKDPAGFAARVTKVAITNSKGKSGNDKLGDEGEPTNDYLALHSEFSRKIGKAV